MNASQLRTTVPLVSLGTEAGHESNEDQETTTDRQSGSLRRKLGLGAAILGVGMDVRRRLYRNDEPETDASADEDEIVTEPDPEESTETEPATAGPSDRGAGLGRWLKLLVVSSLVFALARRDVSRFRSSR